MKQPWPIVKLGAVVSPALRSEAPIPGITYRQIGVRLWGEGAYERETIDGGQTKYPLFFRVEYGDIIVNKIWARNGSVAVVPKPLAGCFATGEFPLFAPQKDKLLPIWFHWLTITPGFWAQCDEKSRGTSGKNRIKPSQFLEIEIPLPPLAEQRRIVTRIEELAAQIQEAQSLRQQAAEEAEALVDSRRNQLFDSLKLRHLPVRLDSVADCRLGKMLDPRFKTGVGSTPYLRNANVQWDHFDLSDVFEMDFTDAERKEFALNAGDILVCEGGDIGKAAIWNNQLPICCYQKALHRVRCNGDKVFPRFMLHHLFWAANAGHWQGMKTQTTIPHLTGIKLKAYSIFLASPTEQRRIVAELDALQAEVDRLKALQAETAAELDALLPYLLDRAFKGEL